MAGVTAIFPTGRSASIVIGTPGDRQVISLGGSWTVDQAAFIEPDLDELRSIRRGPVVFDLSGIERMDMAGAWLVYRSARNLRYRRLDVTVEGASAEHDQLLARAEGNDNPCVTAPPRRGSLIATLEDVGVGTLNSIVRLSELLGFLGLIIARLGGATKDFSRIRVTPLIYHMEQVGFRALPVIGLISFLIGAVMVNQGAIQLQRFGADVLVVDMLAISVLRELGVLLTAIMVAGRSGSAFTAQIGSMKLREEIDAMETIGLHPIDTLVLPRFLALVIMMPILAFYADLMGVIGGALVAWMQLDISPAQFLPLFQAAVPEITTFYIGLIKAPIFGGIIAVSGCFEGLMVSGSAESVGQRTTQSVVQSIFLVIVLDALLAMFFTAVGW